MWTVEIRIPVFITLALLSGDGIAKSPVASNQTDPEILKAIEETEKQAELIKGVRPACNSCEMSRNPTPEARAMPPEDCWDDAAIHDYIKHADFSNLNLNEVRTRKSWGARPSRSGTRTAPVTSKGAPGPKGIVIHHSDGSKNHTMFDVQKWHYKSKGDIAYHFVIAPYKDGWAIYEGRQKRIIPKDDKTALKNMLKNLALGAHAKSANENNIGICIMGDYDRDIVDPLDPEVSNSNDRYPPKQAVQLLGELIQGLMKEYPTIQDIAGHGSGHHYASPSLKDPELSPSQRKIFEIPENERVLDYRSNAIDYTKRKSAAKVASSDDDYDRFYSLCPGRHNYQVVESMRKRFLGEDKGFFINDDVKNGVFCGHAHHSEESQVVEETQIDVTVTPVPTGEPKPENEDYE